MVKTHIKAQGNVPEWITKKVMPKNQKLCNNDCVYLRTQDNWYGEPCSPECLLFGEYELSYAKVKDKFLGFVIELKVNRCDLCKKYFKVVKDEVH